MDQKFLSWEPGKVKASIQLSTFTGYSQICKFSLFLAVTSLFSNRTMHEGSKVKAMVVLIPKLPKIMKIALKIMELQPEM